MFSINIQEKGSESRRMAFNKVEVTIGRVQGNDIVLPKGNVSKRHARIVLKDGKFIIVDQKSTNGTYVNGRKISSPQVVKDVDKIYIGDFIIGVDESSVVMPESAPPVQSVPAPAPPPQSYARPAEPEPPRPSRPTRDSVAPPRPAPASIAPPLRPSAPPSLAPPSLVPPVMATPVMAQPAMAPPPMAQPAMAPPAMAPPPPVQAMAPPAMAPLPPVQAIAPPPVHAPLPVAPAPAQTIATPPAVEARRLVGAGAHAPPALHTSAPMPARSSVGVVRGVALEPLSESTLKLLEVQHDLLTSVRSKLELDSIAIEQLGEEELWQRTERTIVAMVDGVADLPKTIDKSILIKETLNEALGLGALEDLLADPNIDEIMVDRYDRILVGTAGKLRGSGRAFSSEDVLINVLERLVAPLGRVIDEVEPIVDVRLRDGSRLTAMVPPVATRGASLVLRKARPAQPSLSDLLDRGTLSPAMAEYLTSCVEERRNILVAGLAGSGKTAVLAALAGCAAPGERVITVEEVAELGLGRPEWIGLETRPGDSKTAAIGLAQVLRTALRLIPDRLVVGDIVGLEALTVVTALASSTDGAMVGVTGAGVIGGLARIATLARAASPELDEVSSREITALAFDLAVHVVRQPDGSLRIQSIEKVITGGETGFATQGVFAWNGTTFVDLAAH